MRQTLTRAGAVVLAVLALAGCSPISSGYITDKHHTEGYYYPVSYCVVYNSKGICTVWGTRQQWQPPTWKFDIQQGDDEGWVYVSEETYGLYEIGDYWTDPEDR